MGSGKESSKAYRPSRVLKVLAVLSRTVTAVEFVVTTGLVILVTLVRLGLEADIGTLN